MPTLISLVAAGMGISILPTSAVKYSVAAVVGCEIADATPRSEIGMAVSRDNLSAVARRFEALTLQRLGAT
jgi:DNA-binding transcriptional LysR family regulator